MSQIEVTVDVNTNGILNVSDNDKSASKQNQLTITNDKGRLSMDDIEHMVNNAEKQKERAMRVTRMNRSSVFDGVMVVGSTRTLKVQKMF